MRWFHRIRDIVARAVPGGDARRLVFLGVLLVGLGSCSGVGRTETASGEFTIHAGGDGASYNAFESEAFSACPEGYDTLESVPSKSDEAFFSTWRIRCLRGGNDGAR